MNIAYAGGFLREGLKQLGHNVVDMSVDAKHPLCESIKQISCPVDLVLLELYGGFLPASAIGECEYEIAA